MKIDAVLGLASLAVTLNFARAQPVYTAVNSTAPYTLVPLQWSGPVFLDGLNVSLSGPVEDILEQIYELNPSFPEDFGFLRITATTIQEIVEAELAKFMPSNLGRRDTLDCWPAGYAPGSYGGAMSNAMTLQNLGGQCTVGGGPRACSLATRSPFYNTCSTFCNDATGPASASCFQLGAYVYGMVNSPACHIGDQVMGQEHWGYEQLQNLIVAYC